MPPTPVIVAEVVEQPLQEEISLVGRVQPRRSSRVASQVEGHVTRVFAEAGQAVRQGEPIFQLDNDVLRASLVEALADVKLRQFNHAQSLALLKTQAVSEQDAYDHEYQLERARAKLQGLEAQIADLTIRAPFSGHVVQTFAEVGEWVGRGEDVAQLISTDTVRVYVNVPERRVSRMKLGDRADLFLDALGTEPVEGRIAAILAEGYAESHTFPVVVSALNPQGQMLSNMSARVLFRVPQEQSALLVPKDALVSSPFGQVVFLAVEGKAVSRPVKAGLAYNNLIAVEGELRPGDLAVVRGNERLREGQDVRVVRKHQ
jgi:multidrug efflux system membrane fusion protein